MAKPNASTPPAPGRIARRGFGVLAFGALVGGGVFAARWFNVGADLDAEGVLSAPEALAAVRAGEILLVDIRRPDEWQRTGLAQGAVPVDMRRPDFVETLLAHTNGQRDVAVALICARGVRSRAMTQRLAQAGFTRILDVPEGMLGSGAGPGWLQRNLPREPWSG